MAKKIVKAYSKASATMSNGISDKTMEMAHEWANQPHVVAKGKEFAEVRKKLKRFPYDL